MSKEMASLLIGIGVEIIVTIFGVVVKAMPMPLAITFGVIGLALIVYGLVSLIKGKEKKMSDEKQQPTIHVESHDQKGGITAYQVNIQPGDRRLTEANAKGLEDALKNFSFKSVEVVAVMGDGEAFRLASQIKNFLTSKGFDVDGVTQAVYTTPVQGQNIEAPNDKGVIKIIIGNR